MPVPENPIIEYPVPNKELITKEVPAPGDPIIEVPSPSKDSMKKEAKVPEDGQAPIPSRCLSHGKSNLILGRIRHVEQADLCTKRKGNL